uniref:Cadherin domain-containing protein n=1 Tax=Pygocentrus nattereri TaxID=42514 RepID=A0A3B4C1P3_PYGNA
RRWVLSTIELQEEDPGPYPKELFNDKSSMHKLRFSISGQGVNEDPKGVFTIEPFTGAVIVHKPIDRELYPVFLVEFDVADRESGSILDRTLSFSVAIKDINDNAPEFLPEVLHTSIPENTQEGVLPVSLQAKDKDEKGNENSRITMRVVSQDPPSPVITLKPLSARGSDDNVITQLIFTGCFDYDVTKAYKLLVEAQDHGNPVLTSTATVNIDIIDSNTHQPVFTMETNKEILRLSVEDKDTPNTQASKAVYKILKGNEDGNYKIETDPKTNEGVLTVIKGKDYERTTLTQLEISVENEEPLFLCIDGKPASPAMRAARKLNTTKVDVKVIDVNDPPVFQQKIQTVYKKEEGNPGEVLYEPIVKDVDSDADKIRYELVDDPAKWVKVDPKTGKVTTVMKMDRESPYVVNGTYTVVIRAIDNGEPPATGTGTLVIQLGDLNDNAPYLTSNNSIMCGNKTQRVTVKPDDADAPPFAGPFSFSIASEDKKLLRSESSLISLKSLPYGNYLIPLRIEDQQGKVGLDTLNVVVCDCGDKDVCRSPLPRSSNLNGAAIGILLGSLLLLACKTKEFILNIQEEGNQTLINYNEEGGGSLAKVCLSSHITSISLKSVFLNLCKCLPKCCMMISIKITKTEQILSA